MKLERRRFFRIDDTMELFCQPLTAEQAENEKELLEPTNTKDMLASFDRQIHTIIEAARVQAPAVASLAEMMNRKMNFIIDTLNITEQMMERVAFKSHNVNLSACGIAFESYIEYQTGDQVRLEMRLQPNDLQLVILARVIACEPLPEAAPERRFHLRLNFTGISPADQELLIQHIVRRQGQLLQEEREAREEAALKRLT